MATQNLFKPMQKLSDSNNPLYPYSRQGLTCIDNRTFSHDVYMLLSDLLEV